jgi:hypothetical protein
VCGRRGLPPQSLSLGKSGAGIRLQGGLVVASGRTCLFTRSSVVLVAGLSSSSK